MTDLVGGNKPSDRCAEGVICAASLQKPLAAAEESARFASMEDDGDDIDHDDERHVPSFEEID
jgi:hypothetical protein